MIKKLYLFTFGIILALTSSIASAIDLGSGGIYSINFKSAISGPTEVGWTHSISVSSGYIVPAILHPDPGITKQIVSNSGKGTLAKWRLNGGIDYGGGNNNCSASSGIMIGEASGMIGIPASGVG